MSVCGRFYIQRDILSDDDEWPAILISHYLRYAVLAKVHARPI